MLELIAICPYIKCNQVIFRKGKANIDTVRKNFFEFVGRCPHCHNNIEVKLGIKIEVNPIY